MNNPGTFSEEEFEGSLRQFSGAPADAELAQKIGAALARETPSMPRTPWSDRCLQVAMAMGFAAAVVIVTLHASDFTESRAEGPPTMAARAPDAQTSEFFASLAAGKDPWQASVVPH